MESNTTESTQAPPQANTTEVPKITREEKTVKVKDPRRVASGKRLAELSRQAREHKKMEKQQQKQEANEVEQSGFILFSPVCAIHLALVGVGGNLYWKSKDKEKVLVEVTPVNPTPPPAKNKRCEKVTL